MTVANIITILRVVLVPIIIWAMLSGAMLPAFILFLVAGLSDAVDGAVARYFDQQSELGTILDPVADKTLLVSVFIVLSILGFLPLWLVILVVSRDVIIISGILIAFLMGRPVDINPLWISKANTLAQIMLASLVLGLLAFELALPTTQLFLEWITGMLTGLSAAAYVIQGARHLASEDDSVTTSPEN